MAEVITSEASDRVHGEKARYDAFISYSHAADGMLAPAIQTGLQRLARRFLKPRALRVFRDKTSLSANPHLWASIEAALLDSRYFVLLASPQAAGSPWVNQELSTWKSSKSSDHILIVLTDGECAWDRKTGDFDWQRSTALPLELRGVFPEEPLHVDLRWARVETDLSLRHSRFRDAVTDLAAPIHGIPKEDLEGEDVRQHRRTRRFVRMGVTGLALLTAAAIVLSLIAVQQRQRANKQSSIAFSRELAESAKSQLFADPELSLLLALEAMDQAQTDQAKDSLRRAVPEFHPYIALGVPEEAVGETDEDAVGHTDAVSSADFSPDGSLVVTSSADDTAAVWDAKSGERLFVLEGHSNNIVKAIYIPDSWLVATASKDNTGRIWDARSGDELAVLSEPLRFLLSSAGEPAELTTVVASEDGDLVATASTDRMVRVWSVATGELVATLVHGDPVRGAVFSPKGKLLAAGSEGDSACVWMVATGKSVATLKHDDAVEAVAFSRDGTRLITGSDDRTAKIWKAETGKRVAELSGHTNAVKVVAFSPDKRRELVLTASDDRTARVWSAKTWKPKALLLGHTDIFESATFSPDGRLVLTASEDGPARIWDSQKGEELAVLRGHTADVRSAAFTPVRSANPTVVTASDDGTARVWLPRLEVVLRGVSQGLNKVAFSPDGALVATASEKREASEVEAATARVWTLETRDYVDLEGHTDDLEGVAFSPDGKCVATASLDETALLWGLETLTKVELAGHEGDVRGVAFSPDGRFVATASDDGAARIWKMARICDLATPEPIAVLRHRPDTFVKDVAFSYGSTRLATAAGDGKARIWNVAPKVELEPLMELDPLIEPVSVLNEVAFSPDGTLLATAATDETARVWTLATETYVELKGHRDLVESVAFSPTGDFVVTGSADGTARVWIVTTTGGLEVAVFDGPMEDVESVAVAFSPEDGTRVATASSDGYARIYRCEVCVSIDALVAFAKDPVTGVTRELMDDERAIFLHES